MPPLVSDVLRAADAAMERPTAEGAATETFVMDKQQKAALSIILQSLTPMIDLLEAAAVTAAALETAPWLAPADTRRALVDALMEVNMAVTNESDRLTLKNAPEV